MAAIITDDFRRNSVEFLINDIKDKQAASTGDVVTDDDSTKDSAGEYEYFIGIGKSDAWENDSAGNTETAINFSAPIPSGSIDESEEVLDNLIAAVGIADTSNSKVYYLIPRNNWTSGRRYKRWNKNDPDMFNLSTVGGVTYYPSYTINQNKIYVCLDNGSSVTGGFTPTTNTYVPQPSTSAPTGSATDTASREPAQFSSEGYTWAYVADLDTTSKFNTDQFVSITQEATVRTGGTEANGKTDADAATGGIVYGFEIINSGVSTNISSSGSTGHLELIGTNSSSGPESGSTTTYQLTYETDSSGRVSLVKFTSGTTPANFVHDFERGSVRIKPGQSGQFTTAPVIKPLIAPKNGFGYTPTQDLPAFYVGIASDLVGNVEGEASTALTYRQISLLRNIDRDLTGTTSGSADATGQGTYNAFEVYDGLRRVCIDDTTSLADVQAGDIIKDVSTTVDATDGTEPTPALAFVDYVDDTGDGTNKFIYYHQNNSSKINQQEFETSSAKIQILQNDGVTQRGSHSSITVATVGSSASGNEAKGYQNPEAKPRTGEVMFLENRKPIQRASAQTEEIKLVIQF